MITEKIQNVMREKQLWLAAAESCTGGLVSSMITDQSGSSDIFLGGVVSYANEIKSGLLGVDTAALEAYGAVSEQTAREMAAGIRRLFSSEIHPPDRLVSVAITGIAGPSGGSVQKPVGLVWIGIESRAGSECHSFHHNTNRQENKRKFALRALELLYEHLGRIGLEA